MDKTDIAIPSPLVIFNVSDTVIYFFETWQRPPSNIPVLADNSKSFVVLSKNNTLYFGGINPNGLNLLESVSIEYIDIRTLNYKKVLPTSAVLKQIDLAQFNLTCLFKVVVQNVMNQHFVDECNCKLVARWMDCNS